MSLTHRELELIDFMIRFRKKWRLPPTIEEMSIFMGTSRSACQQMVNRLSSKRWLYKAESKTRKYTVNMRKYKAIKFAESS